MKEVLNPSLNVPFAKTIDNRISSQKKLLLHGKENEIVAPLALNKENYQIYSSSVRKLIAPGTQNDQPYDEVKDFSAS